MSKAGTVAVDCLKKNRIALVIFAAMSSMNGVIFILYQIMAEPFVYAEILMGVLLLVLLGIDFVLEYKAASEREQIARAILTGSGEMKYEQTLRDREYLQMIGTLQREIGRLQTEFLAKQEADDEYYTSWVHQIKTPIAVMKLQLTEDTKENRALSCELFRIEQYVEMVLNYIRLESNTRDLLIREYALDEIIRETLRKFAPQFILKKLRLSYETTQETVITDKKWLGFILDQLISNAVKYTSAGEIGVSVHDGVIDIRDTGIGIAAEDQPRIFEKGYTGINGRLGQESSGLGLFLTGKAAELLSVQVTCESVLGQGSVFSVVLPEKTENIR